jgi:poly-gamma-glutamate synthesis protein (capsule biosynthesis protein)
MFLVNPATVSAQSALSPTSVDLASAGTAAEAAVAPGHDLAVAGEGALPAPDWVRRTLMAQLAALDGATGRRTPVDAPGDSPGDAQDGVLLAFVGDILVHTPLQRQTLREPDSYVSLWRDALPYLRGADMTYGNLEGVIAPRVTLSGALLETDGTPADGVVYTGYPLFNYPEELADALAISGFDILSTANNHSLDRFSLGADLTLDILEARGLAWAGTRRTTDSAPIRATITEVAGQRIAWIACTYGRNGLTDPHGQVQLCFEDPDAIMAEIRAVLARDAADAVIVTPHWGREYSHVVTARQRDFARRAIEAGALMVVGNHPHVLQPWEQHMRPDGTVGLAAYSLGNFVSNQSSLPTRTTIVLLARIVIDDLGRARLAGVGYVPLLNRLPHQSEAADLIHIAHPRPSDAEYAAAKELLARMFGEERRVSLGLPKVDGPFFDLDQAVAEALAPRPGRNASATDPVRVAAVPPAVDAAVTPAEPSVATAVDAEADVDTPAEAAPATETASTTAARAIPAATAATDTPPAAATTPPGEGDAATVLETAAVPPPPTRPAPGEEALPRSTEPLDPTAGGAPAWQSPAQPVAAVTAPADPDRTGADAALARSAPPPEDLPVDVVGLLDRLGDRDFAEAIQGRGAAPVDVAALQSENDRLRSLVADLSMEVSILKDIVTALVSARASSAPDRASSPVRGAAQ